MTMFGRIIAGASRTASKQIHTVPLGNTFVYQQSMPRLPIPALESTLKKYLRVVQPLLTAEEFAETTRKVQSFLKNEGKPLHNELLARDKANLESSYIYPFWDTMYYTARAPLPININPFLQFLADPRAEFNTQSRRAATLIASSLKFYDALSNETLEPDVFHMGHIATQSWFKNLVNFLPKQIAYYAAYAVESYPLDMSQYPKLFSSTRIPKLCRDDIKIPTSPSKHIVVMSKNRFFTIDAVSKNGEWKTEAELENDILGVLKKTESSSGPALGVLTTEDRDVWATARQHLESNPKNAASLNTIDTALFVVCLDDSKAPTTDEECVKAFLHGDARNRWFDKSFSIVVSKNGTSAVNFEHAWGDGVSVLRYTNEVNEESFQQPKWWKDNEIAPNNAAQEIHFELDDKTKSSIEVAGKKIDATISALQTKVFSFHGFGKEFLKKMNISPDGVAQMAFQVAYHRQYSKVVSTYESASTAGFKAGRTETIRSCNDVSTEFVQIFNNPEKNPSFDDLAVKAKALRKAVDNHRNISKDAAIGQGIDRHLFALANIAGEQAAKNPGTAKIPEIFSDKAWKLMNHNILSTSTLSSEFIEGGGFGPVVADGYGIGYAVLDDWSRFVLSSYKSEQETVEFGNNIIKALDDIGKLLEWEKQQPVTKKSEAD
eukprot:TRINITY_DN3965_c0_g1_i1.p1 TRINITY_DN3965_c0_g1~~TRINITY_DN3965_c0_g1_i1.p1  ORF type:complete len:661 (+),score=166.79 TRINITY_DN3965_c0_g1_i1:47-2029(+)